MALAIILQSSLGPFFHLNNVQPNLVFVLVLALSLLEGWPEGLGWALVGGLWLDIVAGMPIGTFSLGLMLITGTAIFWQRRYFANIILPFLLTIPYSILFSLSVLITLRLSGYSVPWGQMFSKVIFPESLMNMGLMALIWPALLWLDRRQRRGALTI